MTVSIKINLGGNKMKYTVNNGKNSIMVEDGNITQVIGDSAITIPEMGSINTISKLKNLNPIFQLADKFPELKARLDSLYEQGLERDVLLKKMNQIAFQNRNKSDIVNKDAEGYKFKYGVYIYYGIPSSTLSVIWKADGRIPTQRQYHSDYLDLDATHSAKEFDNVVSDEGIIVNDSELTNAELEQLVQVS